MPDFLKKEKNLLPDVRETESDPDPEIHGCERIRTGISELQ